MGEPVYDVVVSKRYDKGCFKAAPVPPEEFGISARAKDIPTSPYCIHKFQRSASELIEEGYPKDVIDDLPTSNSRASDDNDEAAARDTFADEGEPSDTINSAMRMCAVSVHSDRKRGV